MASMFTATSNLRKSIEIINSLDSAKFPLLLSRILQKFHIKDERTFTQEEEDKLQKVLAIGSAAELQLVIETCEFIFHQAAYHSAKPGTLADELQRLDLEESKVTAIVELWTSGGRDVIARLRQQTLAPRQDPEKIVLEFSHEELYNFYNQLEKIQTQLDALS